MLFLHGFRQSSNKIKKRLHYQFVRKIKLESNAHLTFLNGTHPYRAARENSEFKNDLSLIESQRVWYNLHSENEWDAETESELSESLAHVLLHSKTADNRPVYDGVIGFSQGAVIASILVRKYPSLFKYFISISGYKTTSNKYSSLVSEISDIPSLHVYGLNDMMVPAADSVSLANCFKNSLIETHLAGHFAPDSWPIQQITKFISEQCKHITPLVKSFNLIEDRSEALRLNVYEINFNLLRFDLNALDLESMFRSDLGLEAYRAIKELEVSKVCILILSFNLSLIVV